MDVFARATTGRLLIEPGACAAGRGVEAALRCGVQPRECSNITPSERGNPPSTPSGMRVGIVNALFTVDRQGLFMVVRTRFRAVLVPLALYSVSGAVSGYFLWTAKNGERGSKAKLEYKATIAELRGDLASLEAQRAAWDHRVTLMRSEAVDRDLAEEQARGKLGYVDSRDVEIFTGPVKH